MITLHINNDQDKDVEDIINGKVVHGLFIAANMWSYHSYVREKLLEHPNNANCLYYLGLIEEHRTGKTDLYFKDAAKFGSIPAMYKLGSINGNMKSGVQALKLGYIHQPYPKSLDYYDVNCLREYINELKEENENIKIELEQERLRPPEKGGSEYEKCEQHFNNLNE